MDEGIAQLIEGPPNPVLGPALRRWIAEEEPLPLSWLEGGFTTLDSSVVPAAYAQSLFATRTLVNSSGFAAVRKYLAALKQGWTPQAAFYQAFNQPQADFEQQLGPMIRRWAKSHSPQP